MEREDRNRVARTADEHIAAEVRAELARQQGTGKQLGSVLGLSAFAVSRRLRGLTPFSVSELQATAKYLGVDLADLLPTQSSPSATEPARTA